MPIKNAICCNSRKAHQAADKDKMEAGPHAGDGYCGKLAGSGTDHPGKGRCKHHGGCTPIRKGIYSKVEREELRALVDEFENVDDPMDLTSEVAMARAFLTKFVNNYDDIVTGILTWYTEYILENPTVKMPPPRVPSETKVIMMLDTISKIVKRIQEMKSDHTVTRKDLFRVTTEMGRVVETIVEPEQWEKIRNEWLSIKLA